VVRYDHRANATRRRSGAVLRGEYDDEDDDEDGEAAAEGGTASAAGGGGAAAVVLPSSSVTAASFMASARSVGPESAPPGANDVEDGEWEDEDD
jgi:hypothetical protein